MSLLYELREYTPEFAATVLRIWSEKRLQKCNEDPCSQHRKPSGLRHLVEREASMLGSCLFLD